MGVSSKYNEVVKTYSESKLRRCKQQAKKYYVTHNGDVGVKVLSRVGEVPSGYIRKWMREENWDLDIKTDPLDQMELPMKTRATLKKEADKKGLDEKEELFCYHYMKTYNSTTSAIRAGYSSSFAQQKAYLLLQREPIKKFLDKCREERNCALMIDSMRIIQEYIKIAFSDITDFVKFKGDTLVFHHSDKVDGQLITKIKSGKEGISIELVDKLKALEKLEKYLDVMPNDWKKKVEEKKLELLEERLKIEKSKSGDNGGGDIGDDGFLEALGLTAKDIWKDGGGDNDDD